jgi:hypothetical protein
MAWGQEKGADFHISALRACQYEIFDFVPCSLPLKTLILLTFSCFLIRRRGIAQKFFWKAGRERFAVFPRPGGLKWCLAAKNHPAAKKQPGEAFA